MSVVLLMVSNSFSVSWSNCSKVGSLSATCLRSKPISLRALCWILVWDLRSPILHLFDVCLVLEMQPRLHFNYCRLSLFTNNWVTENHWVTSWGKCVVEKVYMSLEGYAAAVVWCCEWTLMMIWFSKQRRRCQSHTRCLQILNFMAFVLGVYALWQEIT